LVFPAVLLSSLAYLFRRQEVLEIGRHLPRGMAILQHRMEILEIGLLTWGDVLLSWILFCFSFGAICVAAEQLEAGFVATFTEPIKVTCARVRPYLLLCLLLFLILVASVGTLLLISQTVMWLALEPRLGRLSPLTTSFFSYASFGLGALVLSRFSLAVPAFILDDFQVRQAIRQSWQLTRNRTPILAMLLFKSIVGGYLAGMLPFWLAEWIPDSINLPSWFYWALTGASVAAVTVVEPVMFIGFALLYLKTSATSSVSGQVEAVTA